MEPIIVAAAIATVGFAIHGYLNHKKAKKAQQLAEVNEIKGGLLKLMKSIEERKEEEDKIEHKDIPALIEALRCYDEGRDILIQCGDPKDSPIIFNKNTNPLPSWNFNGVTLSVRDR